MNKLNRELHETNLEFMKAVEGVLKDHQKAITELGKAVDSLVKTVNERTDEEEELTGCCDASIVEQTGRCSDCGESV